MSRQLNLRKFQSHINVDSEITEFFSLYFFVIFHGQLTMPPIIPRLSLHSLRHTLPTPLPPPTPPPHAYATRVKRHTHPQ